MHAKPIYHLPKALRSQGEGEREHKGDVVHLHPWAPMPGSVKSKPAGQGSQRRRTYNPRTR